MCVGHGFYDSNTTNSLFTYSYCNNTVTRGHPYKLLEVSVKTSIFGHFFTNRLTNVWNNLPLDVVTAGAVNTFKNRLDIYFQNLQNKTHLNIF